MSSRENILGLDVGDKRVGAALVTNQVSVPRPLATLAFDELLFSNLKELCLKNDIEKIVVGLPRNLEGEDTGQTRKTRSFADDLAKNLNLPVELQDEALTSQKAEQSLSSRKKEYEKPDVDALAAVLILNDYLDSLGSSS